MNCNNRKKLTQKIPNNNQNNQPQHSISLILYPLYALFLIISNKIKYLTHTKIKIIQLVWTGQWGIYIKAPSQFANPKTDLPGGVGSTFATFVLYLLMKSLIPIRMTQKSLFSISGSILDTADTTKTLFQAHKRPKITFQKCSSHVVSPLNIFNSNIKVNYHGNKAA